MVQGLKLQYGHVPLYVRGDDANARQFTSLHGVQRHMVDANKCKMVFEDDEEEYIEFYDWSKLEDELAGDNLKCVLCLSRCKPKESLPATYMFRQNLLACLLACLRQASPWRTSHTNTIGDSGLHVCYILLTCLVGAMLLANLAMFSPQAAASKCQFYSSFRLSSGNH